MNYFSVKDFIKAGEKMKHLEIRRIKKVVNYG